MATMWDKQPVSRIIKMQNLSWTGTGVAVSMGFASRSGCPPRLIAGFDFASPASFISASAAWRAAIPSAAVPQVSPRWLRYAAPR
jgi:hypothetical protein